MTLLVIITAIVEDHEAIKKKIKDLQDLFHNIVFEISDKVSMMNIDVDHFVAILTCLPIEYKEEHNEFIQQMCNELGRNSTLSQVWVKLNMYWDFLNYSLLEKLVQHSGDDPLKRKMTSYVHSLKAFRCSTRLCDYAACCPTLNRPKETHLKEFVLRLKLKWETCTLEDLDNLRAYIIRKFHLPSFTVMLEKVELGSLIVTWLLPAPIASTLIQTLGKIDATEFIKKHGIKSILVDGKKCKYSQCLVATLIIIMYVHHNFNTRYPSAKCGYSIKNKCTGYT